MGMKEPSHPWAENTEADGRPLSRVNITRNRADSSYGKHTSLSVETEMKPV